MCINRNCSVQEQIVSLNRYAAPLLPGVTVTEFRTMNELIVENRRGTRGGTRRRERTRRHSQCFVQELLLLLQLLLQTLHLHLQLDVLSTDSSRNSTHLFDMSSYLLCMVQVFKSTCMLCYRRSQCHIYFDCIHVYIYILYKPLVFFLCTLYTTAVY